jgi:hypothetical protein
MKHLTLSLVILVASLVAAACSSEPDPTSYAEMLRFVPDEADRRSVVVVIDYAALRALPLPEGTEGELTALEEIAIKAEQHLGIATLAPLGTYEASAFPEIAANWERYLGLAIDDIDQSLDAGQPGTRVGVAIGRFDRNAMVALLEQCTECVSPDVIEHAGVAYFDWGEGLGGDRRLEPPVFDHLGRGGQFQIDDAYVLRTLTAAAMTASLDARANDASVIERDDFRGLADALDGLEAHEDIEILSATFSDLHLGPDIVSGLAASGFAPASVKTALTQELLRPYSAYAVGIGRRDAESVALIVLAHDSEADAAENERRLDNRLATTTNIQNQPWSEVFSGWEIERDGTVIIATLEGGIHGASPYIPEPLLFHE